MFPHPRPLKITCLIHSLDGGGAERVMAGLASRFSLRGHRVTLLTLDRGLSDRYVVDDAVVRRSLDVMGESRSVVSALVNLRHRVSVIRRAIVESRPDVVLSFCDRTNILAVMATRSARVPVVISERSDPSKQVLGRAYEWLRGRTYPRADRVIAQTESSANFLESLLRAAGRRRIAGPVDVIASAVDEPAMISDRSVAAKQRRIVSVGRLEFEKGFDRLIDAMAIVSKRHPDWRLEILGDGSRRADLQSKLERLGLIDRVSMTGWVQPVWEKLAESTIYVLPSRYEGFPSALMEAMVAGVPSVAVDCPSGPRAIIEDGRNGLLVSDDVDGIADGIERLIVDEELRERLGLAGREIAERFGWDAMVDRYERVLSEAAGIAG